MCFKVLRILKRHLHLSRLTEYSRRPKINFNGLPFYGDNLHKTVAEQTYIR
jgi:hypothetical protein